MHKYKKFNHIKDNFKNLRNQICYDFEKLESSVIEGPNINLTAGKFKKTSWKRKPDKGFKSGGGGEMSLMYGKLFEKVGVNISTVYGSFNNEMRNKIPGAKNNPNFYATGISVVAHMHSPLIPAVHFNSRFINTTQSWFGGGTDITPTNNKSKMIPNKFHLALKKTCDKHNKNYYPKFKKWCDEYFYLPHREEPRGAGGIFFDNLSNNFDKDFCFVKDIGNTFLNTFISIVNLKINDYWTKKQKDEQLFKRGRYVEFNLLHDRGTAFGLKTQGNIDAIFMSLPPSVSWK